MIILPTYNVILFLYCMPYHSSHRFCEHLQPFSSSNLPYFEILDLVLKVLNPALIHNPLLLCLCSLNPPPSFLISITRKSLYQPPLQKRKYKSRTLHLCSTQSLNRQGHLILLVTHLKQRSKLALLTHLKMLSLSFSTICLS